MRVELSFKKLYQAEGIDWNYVTTGPCVYVFDLPHKAIPCEFTHKWYNVARTRDGARETVTVTVAEGYAFDGCSVVPDYSGTLEASLVHDALYQFVDELSKAWGWRVWTILRFADARFMDVMIFYKVPSYIWRTYYAGVIVFGWVYNRGAKLVRWITGN